LKEVLLIMDLRWRNGEKLKVLYIEVWLKVFGPSGYLGRLVEPFGPTSSIRYIVF